MVTAVTHGIEDFSREGCNAKGGWKRRWDCDTHFIYIGCATRNEIRICGEMCGFVGFFEGFGRAGAQRNGLDRMNRIDRIFTGMDRGRWLTDC